MSKEPTHLELSTELLRRQLGGITFEDVERPEMNEAERKAYNAAIFAVFPRLEADIKRIMYEQVLFVAKESANEWQTSFGRGGIDALAQLLQEWERAVNEHATSTAKPEDFDPNQPISEI